MFNLRLFGNWIFSANYAEHLSTMTKAGMNKAGAMTLLMMIAALAGCVGGETDVDFDQALVDLQPASSNDCEDGGTWVHIGLDANKNGNLDTPEITESVAVCNGQDGDPGPQGAQGPQGIRGPSGEDGTDGANGDSGLPGQDGEQGATGNTGSMGPVGPTGETGPIGPAGMDFVHCLAGDGAASVNAMVEYCPDSTTILAQGSSYAWSLVGSFHSAPLGCDMGEDECEGYAEVPAYDAASQRAFVVNAEDSSVDIIDMSTPSDPTLYFRLVISNGEPNSVAVSPNGLVGVAVAVDPKQDNGLAMFFDTDGALVGSVTAGALPDMITFTNDGTKALVANEGEPDDDYDIDPVGSVTVVDVSDTTSLTATQVGFTSFNSQMATLEASGVRIFGPGATVAQDLEPEYIAVAGDDSTATIVMQENNAVATLDLSTNTITGIHALGFKDYSTLSLDLSDRDGGVNFQSWDNVKGMYQPDAMTSFVASDGVTYYVSANEGDARDYDGYSEEERADDLTLDATSFPDGVSDADLGRLKTTTADDCGDTDGDGDVDFICSYGARSFSIWKYDSSGDFVQVWDSGDEVEHLMSVNGQWINGYTGSRNDDKGSEPEGVITGDFLGRTLAFVALERSGGVMIYDLTDPSSPFFVQYVYMHDHVSPEAMAFVSGADSPNGAPMLIVANEVSGTVAVLQPMV